MDVNGEVKLCEKNKKKHFFLGGGGRVRGGGGVRSGGLGWGVSGWMGTEN